jgi:predicted small lipoprotein YifL
MARILLSITLLVGFSLSLSLSGCSGGKGQVEAPKVTVSAPPNTKDNGAAAKKD